MQQISASVIWDDLKPRIDALIATRISASGGRSAGATGGAVSAHSLSGAVHTGLLGDGQAPQFLLRSGGRSLTGDLAVESGIMVDGVDISAHAAAVLSHIATSDIHVAHSAVTMAAGAGLTGGGTLAASRTFAVGAGLGITVNADDVALASSVAGAGLAYAAGVLSVGVANTGAAGLSVEADAVRLTSSSAPGAAASILASDVSGFLSLVKLSTPLIDTGSGNLTLQPAGDLVLDPVGNDVLPATGYDINLGMLTKKYLTLHAAELWVETLVAQNTIATIGGRVLIGPTTTLTRDLSNVATTIYVKHNQMASGDRTYMEADGKVEFFAITSGATDEGDDYSYSVTRNLDGTGANLWYAGDAMFNTGTTGNGWIDLYSIGSMKLGSAQYGPTIVGNVRASATFNDWGEAWAIGNLNGLYGYGADTYGVGLGQYASGKANITIDPTNGFRLRSYTTDILQIKNSDGLAYIVGSLQLDTAGGIYQGTGSFASPTTGLKIWNDSGFGRIGGYNAAALQWSAGTDGLLYAGGTVIGQHGIRFDNDLALGIYDLAWEDGGTSYGYIRGSYDLNDWLGLEVYSAGLGVFITGATTITGNLTMADTYYIATDKVIARDSGGLVLADDAGNLGVFVEDGGYVGVGTNNPVVPFDVLYSAAANGVVTAVATVRGGADGTLGSLDFTIRLKPSATGASREAHIGTGDALAMRNLFINSNGSGAFGNVAIGTGTIPSGVALAVGGEIYSTTKVSVDGPVWIKEISAPSGISGYGGLYTKTDNKLYFKDGDGTEHTVAFV